MYVGILKERGKIVPEEDAYEYALNECLNGEEDVKNEFREMLVEWFFSGNWIRKEKDEVSSNDQ